MQSIQVTSSALLLAVLMVSCMLQVASAGYNFGYGVNDPSTGDIKDQQEMKSGDQLTGYYRLLDADGMIRTVKYQSHPLTGFTAQVTRDPIGLEGQTKTQIRTSWPSKLRMPLAASNQYLRYDDLEGQW